MCVGVFRNFGYDLNVECEMPAVCIREKRMYTLLRIKSNMWVFAAVAKASCRNVTPLERPSSADLIRCFLDTYYDHYKYS